MKILKVLNFIFELVWKAVVRLLAGVIGTVLAFKIIHLIDVITGKDYS